MGYTLHISEKEIYKQAAAILRPVKFGENGIGICYPGCFIGYLIHALIDSPAILKAHLGTHFHKYQFIPIDMSLNDTLQTIRQKSASYVGQSQHPSEHPDNLITQCKSIIASGYDPYYFIINTHVLPKTVMTDLFDELHRVVTDIPRAGALIFTEANIDEPEISSYLSHYHRFFQNRLWFPVYSRTESESFVHMLARTWDIQLSNKIANNIVSLCGGYLWLLREAVRYIRDNENVTIETVLANSQISQRVAYIFRLLNKRTVDTLSRLCLDQNNDVPGDVLHFVISTGLVVSDEGKYHLSCPLLSKHVSSQRDFASINLGVDKTIWFKNKSIHHLFGSSEARIMSLLLTERGKLVSREQIAKTLWKSAYADNYSDWAIDKAVSRIRKVLASVGMPKSTVVTKKKFGFYLC